MFELSCKYEHFFFFKTGNLIVNSVSYKLTVLQTPYSLTKYEVKVTSQNPIFQLFKDNCEKFRSTAKPYIKNPILHLFPELGKIEKPSKSNIQTSQNLFVNWEKLLTTV